MDHLEYAEYIVNNWAGWKKKICGIKSKPKSLPTVQEFMDNHYEEARRAIYREYVPVPKSVIRNFYNYIYITFGDKK